MYRSGIIVKDYVSSVTNAEMRAPVLCVLQSIGAMLLIMSLL